MPLPKRVKKFLKETREAFEPIVNELDKAGRTADTTVSKALGLPEGVKVSHAFSENPAKSKPAVKALRSTFGLDSDEEVEIPLSNDPQPQLAPATTVNTETQTEKVGPIDDKVQTITNAYMCLPKEVRSPAILKTLIRETFKLSEGEKLPGPIKDQLCLALDVATTAEQVMADQTQALGTAPIHNEDN